MSFDNNGRLVVGTKCEHFSPSNSQGGLERNQILSGFSLKEEMLRVGIQVEGFLIEEDEEI